MPKARPMAAVPLADRALADDAERGAVQIADVVREEAELLGLVPDAVLDVLPVGEQVAPQRQDHRERVLRHRVHRVVADIGDGDAVRLAIGDVDTS
jgi:hypothetical protein